MKKYRLKQWYPSLPAELKVGNIVEFNGVDSIRLEIRKKYEFTEYCWEFDGLELECTQYWELIEEKYCDCNIPIFTLNSTFCRKCLKDIEEKKPLFITEDGVKMLDRDSIVWMVRNKTLEKIKIHSIHLNECDFEHKVFSHESIADEYILMNKRVFSYNDIEKFLSGGEGVWYDVKAIAKRRSEG